MKPGLSTGIALRTLGEAMMNPGKEIRIKDHHFSAEADHHLTLIMQNISIALRLTRFEFNFPKRTVVFKLP